MQAIRNLFLCAPSPPISKATPASPRDALAAIHAKIEAEQLVQSELRARLERIRKIEGEAEKALAAVQDFKAQHAEVVNRWLLHGGEQPRINGEGLTGLEAAQRDAGSQAAAAAASRPETERLLLASIQRHSALLATMRPYVRAVLHEELARAQLELSAHVRAAGAVIERLEGLRALGRLHLHQHGELLVQGIGELPKLPMRRKAVDAARETWRRLIARLGADALAVFEDVESPPGQA